MKKNLFNLICAIIPLRKLRDKFCAPINQKLDDTNQKLDHMDGKLDDMNQKFGHMNGKLDDINHKFDYLNGKSDDMNHKIDYIIDFLKHTTDITKIPAAYGKLRLLQMGHTKLLRLIDLICHENKLSYWLCGGTLIGAVRHGGFIPWDDDTDICMMRNDYEKLIELLGGGNIKTDGPLTYNVGDILKIFYKDTTAKVDVWPYDNYHSRLDRDEQKSQLVDKLLAARKKIVWDWKNVAPFFPDYIPIADKTYKQIVEIQNTDVMDGKPANPKGSIFRGIETIVTQDAKTIYQPEDVFPLQRIKFEQYEFYAPNNINKFFQIYGEDIFQFPHHIAPDHEAYRLTTFEIEEKLKEFISMNNEILLNEVKNEEKRYK